MQVSGNFSISGVDAARSPSRTNNAPSVSNTPSTGIQFPTDQLDLSPEALAVGNNQPSDEVFRADKVASLREAIAGGNYDTDERVSKALDKFLDQLG